MKIVIGELRDEIFFYPKIVEISLYDFLKSRFEPHCFTINAVPSNTKNVIGILDNFGLSNHDTKKFFGCDKNVAKDKGWVVEGKPSDFMGVKTIRRKRDFLKDFNIGGVPFSNNMGNWSNLDLGVVTPTVDMEDTITSWYPVSQLEGKMKLNFKLPYKPILITEALPNISINARDRDTLVDIAQKLSLPRIDDKSIKELNNDIMTLFVEKSEAAKPVFQNHNKLYCFTEEKADQLFGDKWRIYVERNEIKRHYADNDILDIVNVVSRIIPLGEGNGTFSSWSAPYPTEVKLSKTWVFCEVLNVGG